MRSKAEELEAVDGKVCGSGATLSVLLQTIRKH